MDSLKKKIFKKLSFSPNSSLNLKRPKKEKEHLFGIVEASSCPSIYRHEDENSFELKTDQSSEFSSTTMVTNDGDSSTIVDKRDDAMTTPDYRDFSFGAHVRHQIFRKQCKQIHDFNLMVLGSPGLGKATLVNSFFLREICSKDGDLVIMDDHYGIRRRKVNLIENGTSLSLNIIDSPEFGCSINNTGVWDKVAGYIKEQHLIFNEMKFDTSLSYKIRSSFDCRVHLCLYFISPIGLTQLDLATLKALQGIVAIVPIIARSDCLNQDELYVFRMTIRRKLQENYINTFNFRSYDDSSLVEKVIVQEYHKRFPLALVSGEYYADSGCKRRIRECSSGSIDVDNINVCDFQILHHLVMKFGFWQLISATNESHASFMA